MPFISIFIVFFSLRSGKDAARLQNDVCIRGGLTCSDYTFTIVGLQLQLRVGDKFHFHTLAGEQFFDLAQHLGILGFDFLCQKNFICIFLPIYYIFLFTNKEKCSTIVGTIVRRCGHFELLEMWQRNGTPASILSGMPGRYAEISH